MSDPADLATLEQQNENLRARLNDAEGMLRIMSQQLQLVIQMALRHDWTLDGITKGQLMDREFTGTVEGSGVQTLPIPVPLKNWCAILVPQKESKIVTSTGAHALLPKQNGSATPPKLATVG